MERIYHQDVFAELKRGLFLIRGENVVLLGEIVRLFDAVVVIASAYPDDLCVGLGPGRRCAAETGGLGSPRALSFQRYSGQEDP